MTVTTGYVLVRRGPVAVRWRTRNLLVGGVLSLSCLIIGYLSLGISSFPLSPLAVGRVLLGGGDKWENYAILDVQLPRITLALCCGFGLALAGALTQTASRNPLASPDMVGITAGASVFAVLSVSFAQTWGRWLTPIGTPGAALLGGALAGLIMFALTLRRSGIDALRLVLSGVALTWFAQAAIGYLLIRANTFEATAAQRWIVGSVDTAQWGQVRPLAYVLPPAIVACAWLSRALRIHALGDEVAGPLGVSATRMTALTFIIAVVVAAVATSGAGPIAFVALLAPQLALRLAKSSTPGPVNSGWVGAILVLIGDLLCRTVFPGLAVGIMTAAIGGPFLVYLLIQQARSRR